MGLGLRLRLVCTDFGGSLTIGMGFPFGFGLDENGDGEEDAKMMVMALAVCRGVMVWLIRVEGVLVFFFHSSCMEWISSIQDDSFVRMFIFGCWCWIRVGLRLVDLYADFGGSLMIGLDFEFGDAKRMDMELAVCKGVMVWLVIFAYTPLSLVLFMAFIFVFVLM